MPAPRPNEVTRLLLDWSHGDKAALDQLLPVVYGELRKLASAYLRRERPDHTLEPTALIHEVYLRLVDQNVPQWNGRVHFYGVAARLMRQILVDHARRRAAARRGGDQLKTPLVDAAVFSVEQAVDLMALDEALQKLEAVDERKCRVVEMRAFAGMNAEETATVLDVSVQTVKRDLRLAKAWLAREMEVEA